MKNNRLFEYLQALSNKDWKSLNKHLEIYTLKNADLKTLVNHLYKHHPMLPEEFVNTAYIHKNLFADKTRKNTLNLFSTLTQIIKDFLIQDQLSLDTSVRNILLLQALNKRQLYRQADQLRISASNTINQEKISWWNALYLQLINHYYYFSDNPASAKKDGHLLLKTAKESVKLYFEQIEELYNFDIHHNIKLNKLQYESLSKKFNYDPSIDDDVKKLMNLITEVRVNNSVKAAKKLEFYFSQQHEKLSAELRLITYIVLRIFYAGSANLGNLNYADALFKLQKLMIEKKYIDYHSQIAALRFIGIVELAAFINKTEWGQDFIGTYIRSVPFSQRRIVKNICDALILFGNKNYKASIDILSSTYPRMFKLKSTMNRLLLINYLELYYDDTIFLTHKLESYKLFLYRNKKELSSRTYEASTNFASIVGMIVRKEESFKIINRIKTTELLFFRLYLLKKLE